MRENKKAGKVFEYSKQREEAIARRRTENIFLNAMQNSQSEQNYAGTGSIQPADSMTEF